MLAEKDPIIMGLLAAYGNVTMPNMHLNEIDVTALLEYLDTESRRVERAQSTVDSPPRSQQQD